MAKVRIEDNVQVIRFDDMDSARCVLQDNNGSNPGVTLLLGTVPAHVQDESMHLSRKQVIALYESLGRWIATKSFK